MERDIVLKLKILEMLYEKNEVFQITRLQELMNVNRKTIALYIKQLNQSLPNGWYIESRKGIGAQLIKPDYQNLNDVRLNILTESVVTQLFFKLIGTKDYTLKEMSEVLFVSQVQVKKMLVQFSAYLTYFNLKLEIKPKIKIIGNEETIRTFLYWTMLLITRGKKPTVTMIKEIPSLKIVKDLIDHSFLSTKANKWRIAVCAVICMERSKKANHYSDSFIMYLNTLHHHGEVNKLIKVFKHHFSQEDIDFIDITSNNFFYTKDYFKLAEELNLHLFKEIMKDFLVLLRLKIGVDTITDFDVLLTFTYMLRKWLFEACFELDDYSLHLETMRYYQIGREEETYIQTLFKQLNVKYPINIFNNRNSYQLESVLKSMLTDTKLVKISLVFSTLSGHYQNLIAIIRSYHYKSIINTFDDISLITSSNTDLLLTDLSFELEYDIKVVVVSSIPNKRETAAIYEHIDVIATSK